MATIAYGRLHGRPRCCRRPAAAPPPRLAMTRCRAAPDDDASQQQTPRIPQPLKAPLAWLEAAAAACRSGKPEELQQQSDLLDVSPQQVEAVLERLEQRASSRRSASLGAKCAAEEEEARLEALRRDAVQRTGMAPQELQTRTEMICNLVPGMKEEQLLKLRAEVLRELCSDVGVATAAQYVLRTQGMWEGSRERQQLLRYQVLLTASGHQLAAGVELDCKADLKAVAFAQQGRTLVTLTESGYTGTFGSEVDSVGLWDLSAAQPTCTNIYLGCSTFHDSSGPDSDDMHAHEEEGDLAPPVQVDRLECIAVHPDGRHLLVGGCRSSRTCSKHGTVHYHERSLLGVLDLETRRWVTGAVLGRGGIADCCRSIAVVPGDKSEEGKQLVVTANDSRRTPMDVWELVLSGAGEQRTASLAHLHCAPTEGAVSVVVPAPCTQLGLQSVLTGGEFVDLWLDLRVPDINDTEPLWTPLNSHVQQLAVCPQGHLAAAAACFENMSEVVVWDLLADGKAATVNVHNWIHCSDKHIPTRCIAISPDGRHLVAGNEWGKLLVWDLQSLKQVLHFPTGQYALRFLVFSPDAGLLLAGGWDGKMCLWQWEGLVQLMEN